jgi:HSP20 family protein
VRTLPLDIRQTDEAFYIEASMPGFRPGDVEITFDENVLTIRGGRPQEDATDRGVYVQRERQLSSVHRRVYLPAQVKAEQITAGFDNGVLTIVVPREQKAQPQRIPVSFALGEQPKVIEAPVAASAGV